ncbi:NAD(P)/FAD-dependent oxidoreductase [Nitratifractor sp.]
MSEKVLKKLIIVGGGFAGLRALYRLRDYDYHFEITVIDRNDYSQEKPALPEVAVEGKEPAEVRIELPPVMRRHDAAFVQAAVERIDPEARKIHLDTGESLSYDYLILAPGAVKDYDAIPGFREYGYSICDDEQALRLHERLERFEGGRIVLGTARSQFGHRVKAPELSAPCEGPIGELAFMLDHRLKKEGKREKSSFEIFSPSKIFFEDVGERAREPVAKLMEERGMKIHTGKILAEIGEREVRFEDGTTLPSDLTIVIPPYRAPEFIARSGLGDEKGWVPTDETMRHLDHPEIYAAGDVNALAQPKLGHIAIHQADIAVSAILRAEGLAEEIVPYHPEVFCIMNMGGAEATLIFSDALYGGEHDLAWHSLLAKLMKTGFDEEYHYTHGHMPPDRMVEVTEEILKHFSKEKSSEK